VDAPIRLATVADARALAELRYEFRASIAQPTEEREAFVARTERWMTDRLRVPGPWYCWVAEREDVIVGNLWMQLIEKVPNPIPEQECHAYITNVYVRPAARGGIGERLLEAAIATAREARVDAVILWPTEQSRSLYARHGFAVRGDLLEAVLDSERIVAPQREGGESVT